MLRLPVCLVCCLLAAGPALAGDPATTGGQDLSGSMFAGGPAGASVPGSGLLHPAPGAGVRAPDIIGLRPARGGFDWRANGSPTGFFAPPATRAATFPLRDSFRF